MGFDQSSHMAYKQNGSVLDILLETGDNSSPQNHRGPHYNLTSHSNMTSNNTNTLYQVPVSIVVVLSLLYGIVSLLAICGNVLVMLVIVKNRKMHTVTNFFIANLACADILIGLLSTPFQFQAALLQRWNLPDLLCPIAPFVKELSVSVSILTLAVISVDRYFAVIHPLKPRCSKSIAKIVMVVLWIFCVASALPAALVFRVMMYPDNVPGTVKPVCLPVWPEVEKVNLPKLYRLYLVMIQYFVPLVIICYAYFRIICRIWGTHAPGTAVDARDQMMNRNKRKVSQILFVLPYIMISNTHFIACSCICIGFCTKSIHKLFPQNPD